MVNLFEQNLRLNYMQSSKGNQFHFDRKDVENLLAKEMHYPEEIKTRVLDIVMSQRQKYQYLF